MLYTHILAATDFSAVAYQVLRYACEEATVHHARLTVVHVLQHHPASETYHRDYAAEAQTHLRDLVCGSFTGTWEAEVTTGDPAEAILQIAQDRDVDLIVIGTHGRTGLQHMVLGSVAEKVVRHARCPVLVVRA
jgi:universal stress protein A